MSTAIQARHEGLPSAGLTELPIEDQPLDLAIATSDGEGIVPSHLLAEKGLSNDEAASCRTSD